MDRYQWLEDLDSPASMTWVRERNAETFARLTSARYEELAAEIRAVLDSDARIPDVYWHGELLYNLWQDAAHPKGLWRRTTLAGYRRSEPDWEPLLDLDELSTREGENWVWQSVDFLRPAGTRCLLSLSRGGADAAVVREFDLDRKAFVDNGFSLPEAKSAVGWIDLDRLYVGIGDVTSSGYPRTVREWRRGTPLSEARLVFAAEYADMMAWGEHDPTPGFERDLVHRRRDFYRGDTYLRTGAGLVRIDVPEDAELSFHREWLLIALRTGWLGHPGGSLLITPADAFLAGRRDLRVVFEPAPRTALNYYSWTRDRLIVTALTDVVSRPEAVTPDGTTRTPLGPAAGHTEVSATNPDHSDEYLLLSTGFTEPNTLWYGQVGAQPEVLRREPAFFDATGLSVRQFFATSPDGTRVPYFVVGRSAVGPGPTLLTGYGGFEISRTPAYDAVTGRGWLARGGTYVVANIRGGGEYGPEWHRAALRENRPRAYEDFAAVATDLVARGITTPRQLGAQGGSNGGLLMGVMLTRYPELFGAIVSQVPLLDMRRYHRLLAGASWMAEYGDPDDESDWAYLRTFSPYHNVAPGRPYPPVLFVTSTRDDRVHPGHARKMVALLREHGHDVTYYENIEGGHGAAADNRQRAVKAALIYEFLWQRLAPAPSPG